EETRLESAVDVARERVEQIDRAHKHAQDRIREIDAYLNADKTLAAARAAWNDGAVKLRELRTRAAQVDEIARSLREEIDTLEDKRQRAIEEHGNAEISARLAGKAAPAGKALAAFDVELSSRRAA